MENNNHKKRKVMLIAAFAVAVIALAGVGYAAVAGYKGTTVITDNDAEGKVIVVTDTGGTYTGSFGTSTVGEVPINTYTDATYNETNTLYTLEGATEISGVTGVYGKQVGGTLALSITGNTTASYTLNVELQGTLNASAGWKYYIKVGETSYTAISGNTATVNITGLEAGVSPQNINVALYITSTTPFEDEAFPNKAITDDTTLDGYSGFATVKGSPVDANGYFFKDLKAVFTFVTVAA